MNTTDSAVQQWLDSARAETTGRIDQLKGMIATLEIAPPAPLRTTITLKNGTRLVQDVPPIRIVFWLRSFIRYLESNKYERHVVYFGDSMVDFVNSEVTKIEVQLR